MSLKLKIVLILIAGICAGLWLRYESFGHKIHKLDETDYIISSHSLFTVNYRLILTGKADNKVKQLYFVETNPVLPCENEIEVFIDDASNDIYLSGRFIDTVCLRKNGMLPDKLSIAPGQGPIQVSLARSRDAMMLNDKRLVLVVGDYELSVLSLLMIGMFYCFAPFATILLLAIIIKSVLSRLSKLLGIRKDEERGA